MVFSLYAVRDELLGYSMPVIRDNDSVASRAFEYDCSIDNTPYKIHPEHFTLIHIGEYDTESGAITSTPPRIIAFASDFIKRGE